MVCTKCEKKLAKGACPDKWKEGSTNTIGAGRKLNENKMLSKAKRWAPYSAKCTGCKASLQPGYTFCQKCAYSKGICAMCGGMVMDLKGKGYKQSTT